MAMRLTGASFAARADAAARDEKKISEKFDSVVRDATALLKGEKTIPGLDPDEIRDRLLSGFRHIVVDEYQDIDADQYALVSAVAGRTLQDPDSKLSILAVGDDDQSIYKFRGANVEFIRRFQEDYGAKVQYLVENYRSTANIVAAANELIRKNRDRVKIEHPIRIDRRREADPPGGRWESIDPLARGRVQRLSVANVSEQAATLAVEIERIQPLDPDFDWTDVAVLSRNGFEHPELSAVRGTLETAGIPYSRPLDRQKGFSLHRVREIREILDALSKIKSEIMTAAALVDIHADLMEKRACGETAWDDEVRRILAAWETETGNAELPVRSAVDFIYETLAEQRREQRLGRGVFLGTAHGAKGLEFPHVFILDGGWRTPSDATEMEEERRVYYVAMTRAMKTLTVFRRTDCRNPHVEAFDGPYLLDRSCHGTPGCGTIPRRSYVMLGLSHVYLDFAGHFPQDAPVHRALSNLKAGDPLRMQATGGRIELVAENDTAVARLSRRAEEEWRTRICDSEKITVVAMVSRRAEDAKPEFRERLKCDFWEVPVAEIAAKTAFLASGANNF